MEAYQRVPVRMSLNVRKRSCESIYLDEQEQILQQAREALARHERFCDRMHQMETIQEESTVVDPLTALREETAALELQLAAQEARNQELEWMNKREVHHNPKFLTGKLPASCTPPRRRRLPNEKYVDNLQDYALKSSKAYQFLIGGDDKRDKDTCSDYGSGESLNTTASQNDDYPESVMGSSESVEKLSSSSSILSSSLPRSRSKLSSSLSCSSLLTSSINEAEETDIDTSTSSSTNTNGSTNSLKENEDFKPRMMASRQLSDPVISKSLPSSPIAARKSSRDSVVFQDRRFQSTFKNTLPRSRLSIVQMIEDFQQKCSLEQKQQSDSDYEILDNPNTKQQLVEESEYEEMYNSGSGEEGFYWFSKSIPVNKYSEQSQLSTTQLESSSIPTTDGTEC